MLLWLGSYPEYFTRIKSNRVHHKLVPIYNLKFIGNASESSGIQSSMRDKRKAKQDLDNMTKDMMILDSSKNTSLNRLMAIEIQINDCKM